MPHGPFLDTVEPSSAGHQGQQGQHDTGFDPTGVRDYLLALKSTWHGVFKKPFLFN
jgi:hypothetical protein